MDKKYHVVVVGGGIAGLSTAIAYAKNANVGANPILVLEKAPKVGGMVTSFKRDGYLFDTVQMIPEVTHLFEYFGVDLPLRRFEGHCARLFLADPASGTAERVDIPSGISPFKEMLMARFPDSGTSAAQLVDYSAALYDELKHLRMESSWLGNLSMLLNCRRIIASTNLTFQRYMNKFGVIDPALREIFEIFTAFAGMPAERVPALLVASVMTSTLRGCYRPTRGFIKLPHVLRKRAEALGAEIRCKSRVEKIVVEDGAVKGVVLEGGDVIAANYVVTAMDTKVALLALVGEAQLRRAEPTYAERLNSIKMSPSSMTISLGLDDHLDLAGLGMDCGYNVITTGKGTFEKMFQAFDRGEIGYSDRCFHTAAISPSLTTGGKQTIIIRVVPMPVADWVDLRNRDPQRYAERKKETADFFISQVERYLIPSLTRHIKVIDIASPATFERYVGTPTGSIYDMAPYPDNFGRTRLKLKTPIKGLLLPKFTHGIYGGLQAGIHTADHILGGAVCKGRFAV